MANSTLSITPDGINRIKTEFVRAVNGKIRESQTAIKNDFIAGVIQALIKSPDFSALLGGSALATLEGELGTKHIKVVMIELLSLFADQVSVTYKPFRVGAFHGIGLPAAIKADNIDGSFSFSMIEADFIQAVSLPLAEYTSVKSSNKVKTEIPWLRWLLMQGYVTIDNFRVEMDLTAQQAKASRTGRALMVKDNSSHWVLPEPYRGDSINHNFVTRALDEETLSNIFIKILQKHLKASA